MNDHFADLDDAQSQHLYEIETRYWDEACKCQQAGAYIAGCAMLGAALEAGLMAMVIFHASEVAKCNTPSRRKNAPKHLLEWNLGELLGVAREMGWLPASGVTDRDPILWSIGDHAQAVRLLRNLVHPGRYVKDFAGLEVNADELRAAFKVLQGVYVHLHAALSAKRERGD